MKFDKLMKNLLEKLIEMYSKCRNEDMYSTAQGGTNKLTEL